MNSTYSKPIKPVKYLKCDVAVIGAGPAGSCAAISAARNGMNVILVEQGGCAGGMATQGLVGPFMTCYDKSGKNQIIKGMFEEIVEDLVDIGGAIHPSKIRKQTAYTSWIEKGHDHVTPFDSEKLKLVLDGLLVKEGIRVLYHTTFTTPVIEENAIKGVIVYSKSGFEQIDAKAVIDCTGDADVAAASGVSFEKGNKETGASQPATMFFRMCNVDDEAIEADIEKNKGNFYRKDGVNYRSFHWWVEKAKKNGDWDLDRTSLGLYKGVHPDEWCANISRLMNIDSTDNESMTRGEIEGRRQVDEIFRMIRKYIPGCQDARLMSTGSTLGIRESRHIDGMYRLELEDILEGKVPDDSILVCANSVDVHGRFGPSSNEYITMKDGEYYGLPYRCLVPNGVDGLLVAGRSLSASSEAAGAVRVMPPVMAMGQAAGTAAALAVKSEQSFRGLDTDKLKDALIEQKAFLG